MLKSGCSLRRMGLLEGGSQGQDKLPDHVPQGPQAQHRRGQWKHCTECDHKAKQTGDRSRTSSASTRPSEMRGSATLQSETGSTASNHNTQYSVTFNTSSTLHPIRLPTTATLHTPTKPTVDIILDGREECCSMCCRGCSVYGRT